MPPEYMPPSEPQTQQRMGWDIQSYPQFPGITRTIRSATQSTSQSELSFPSRLQARLKAAREKRPSSYIVFDDKAHNFGYFARMVANEEAAGIELVMAHPITGEIDEPIHLLSSPQLGEVRYAENSLAVARILPHSKMVELGTPEARDQARNRIAREIAFRKANINIRPISRTYIPPFMDTIEIPEEKQSPQENQEAIQKVADMLYGPDEQDQRQNVIQLFTEIGYKFDIDSENLLEDAELFLESRALEWANQYMLQLSIIGNRMTYRNQEKLGENEFLTVPQGERFSTLEVGEYGFSYEIAITEDANKREKVTVLVYVDGQPQYGLVFPYSMGEGERQQVLGKTKHFYGLVGSVEYLHYVAS